MHPVFIIIIFFRIHTYKSSYFALVSSKNWAHIQSTSAGIIITLKIWNNIVPPLLMQAPLLVSQDWSRSGIVLRRGKFMRKVLSTVSYSRVLWHSVLLKRFRLIWINTSPRWLITFLIRAWGSKVRKTLLRMVTKRHGNCPALAPVECNEDILEALIPDAKRLDFRMKEVGKTILQAATIIIKSLWVLDKVAQEEGNSVVAYGVGMINGALALLWYANYKNNLARCFNIKREINQKYSHLCSDKVPMTRLLFGDDVSQSARQIDKSEKLKSNITTKKTFPAWRSGFRMFGGGKTRSFLRETSSRGFSSKYQPYGQRKSGYKGDQRHSYPSWLNSRAGGHSIPRQ